MIGNMLKKRAFLRWESTLILAVLALTVYNILPTVFFYTKPLKKEIGQKESVEIRNSIESRVNNLEKESRDWVKAYCDHLNLKGARVLFDTASPSSIAVSFQSEADASIFTAAVARAGSLIPFVPAQLTPQQNSFSAVSKTVLLQRRIPIHFEQDNTYFTFSEKLDGSKKPTALWKEVVYDRTAALAETLGGVSENGAELLLLNKLKDVPEKRREKTIALAQNIVSFAKTFGSKSPITQKYFASFSQVKSANKTALVAGLLDAIRAVKLETSLSRSALQKQEKELKLQDKKLTPAEKAALVQLMTQEKMLTNAENFVTNNKAIFESGKAAWTRASYLDKAVAKLSAEENSPASQALFFEGRSPFFDKLTIDWEQSMVTLHLSADFTAFKAKMARSQQGNTASEQADQFLFNSVAALSQQLGEELIPCPAGYKIPLSHLADSNSFLSLDLKQVAQKEVDLLRELIVSNWSPVHQEFQPSSFPLLTYGTYKKLPLEEKKLGLVIYAPVAEGSLLKGFNNSSTYVIVKGGSKIFQRAQSGSDSESLSRDFQNLMQLLQNHGYFGMSAANFNVEREFASDFIFIKENYFQDLIKATREDFQLLGSKKRATLELSNWEQRLLTLNRIEDQIHEDLLKQRDDYRAAKLGTKGLFPIDVPKPTRNPLIENFKLSFKKYFRGDNRKILHWGLDLSGGKTVHIELRDINDKTVTSEADLKQGINELYNRVNKMGVSEVSIRQEGSMITLDFPGSQLLSATELVKPTSMRFQLINEQFSKNNEAIAAASNRFLQEVWNKAVVTGKKSPDDINKIACAHLYGSGNDAGIATPMSESARTLYEQGLRLARQDETLSTSSFDTTFSKIAVRRGEDPTQWEGNSHPLVIIFNNFALEGASLADVHASFDQTSGNFLSFTVKDRNGSAATSPRDDLHAWTDVFSKEKIAGSAYAAFSNGKGWRMAVILNGYMISSPHLDSALRDAARITGNFTQREVNQLEADLKAGSLKFTPHILSEKNISPELGVHERKQAIITTACSILLVIISMVVYYRFGGVVASVAVLFNLLLIWAALQNIGATISLAGIAGIILTIGMAVDANVLVFERIREEFTKMKKKQLATAISIGYRKAFSAIVDSNVTTIIAALILLNFDSGPIKGFAVTLIIGIVSSMFTALFMTRVFFEYWVKKPENTQLKMAEWIKPTKFNFLKTAPIALFFSLIIMIAGGVSLAVKKDSVFGMDFTGGFALNLELEPKEDSSYREIVEKALISQGLSSQDFGVRELTPSNHIRLFLNKSATLTKQFEDPIKLRTDNTKITWLVTALEKSGVNISDSSLQHLDANWSDVSGQMSDSMRNSAIIGLSLALAAILVYITLRFEFKYAISATLCIAHDVLFTIAMIGLLYALKVPVQIDLHTVAALMTIVGYSLNDTIIIFDRIREDVKKGGHKNFAQLINHSVNTTLSRTLMTSITTLLVIIPLVCFGGATIFGFSLVMGIGVVFGTLSSLFVAAPLLHYFDKLELKRLGVTAHDAEQN